MEDEKCVAEAASLDWTPTHVKTLEEYRILHKRSLEDPEAFWADQAKTSLDWFRDFDFCSLGDLEEGSLSWFINGKLNACYNCVDRHAAATPDKVAIIWESDEPGEAKTFTYKELLKEVCKLANAFKEYGVQKNDTVAIYMPMIPQLAFSILACARIGAPHSIVFGGFSSEALKERILDAKCKFVITADEGCRGGRTLSLKRTVDAAVAASHCVERVFVFRRTNNPSVAFSVPRDVWIEEETARQKPYCPAEPLDSEHPLFFLYTSGSTGKPKGLVHTTAGYLLYATVTQKYVFDTRPGDVFGCVADCGWITGHSYVIYGPLSNGCTSVMFESTPLYPTPARYWEMVEKHKITQFYTAPTAIRALMRFGEEYPLAHDMPSLRVLGSVGEPINPEAWHWYHRNVGKGRCAIVDTYWQTETGGIVVTPLPGAIPTKPGSACTPFFGVKPVLVDEENKVITEPNVQGFLCLAGKWPGLARTIHRDHGRYMSTYLAPVKGHYYTGDGAKIDEDGFVWITGRVDDVLNVSGHRVGSAEVESALVAHDLVAEAAVVGFPHPIKGEGICCFVTLLEGVDTSAEIEFEMKGQVRTAIGPIATPDIIVITPDLPKTRSGKIMRRLLRKIVVGDEDLGDTSTLKERGVVGKLFAKCSLARKASGLF